MMNLVYVGFTVVTPELWQIWPTKLKGSLDIMQAALHLKGKAWKTLPSESQTCK